jgi:hypothetical protein
MRSKLEFTSILRVVGLLILILVFPSRVVIPMIVVPGAIPLPIIVCPTTKLLISQLMFKSVLPELAFWVTVM